MGIGKISKEDMETYDSEELNYRQLLIDFEKWVLESKPVPEVKATESGQISIPFSFCRSLTHGKDSMQIQHTDGKWIGVVDVPIYEKEMNPKTGKEEKTGRILSYRINDTATPFDEKLMQKKLKEADRLLGDESQQHYYIKHEGTKFSTERKTLTLPLEQLKKRIDKMYVRR